VSTSLSSAVPPPPPGSASGSVSSAADRGRGPTGGRPRALAAGALPLRDVLEAPTLARASVVAGATGLDRMVERLNVMEVPDIVPWVKPDEFLLTTAYPLREDPTRLVQLVRDLDEAGLAGVGVKLGRYLDRLPDAALAVADELGLPLVLLPDDVSFDEILNEVLTTILNQTAQRLARTEQVHRALIQLVLDGQGLDAVADELARLVEVPVAVVGHDGEQLASSDRDATAGLVVEHGRVLVAGEVVAAECVPVSAGQRVHGHLVALGAHEHERRVLESASTVAALAITMRLEVEAVESKYQSDLVHDLLTGRAELDDALARARMFGWDLDRRLLVLVARLDEPSSPVPPEGGARRLPLATTLRHLVHEHDPRAAIVRFSDEVVVLTEAFDGPDGRDRGRAFARALSDAGSRPIGVDVSVGLSRPVVDLHDIPTAYAQATRALRIGRTLQGPGAAAHFDDLGVYRVLSLIDDTGELTGFASEVLGDLADGGEQSEDLLHTLEVLLDANGNVAEAARRLHFHYNTLRYRVEKLEGILGPFSDDALVRLDVHVALLIHRMRGL